MWHEARRRERATQKLFSDHKRRAEKRREENKVDPSSLLQVHGVKSKVNIDPTTHKLAANSMVVWQGDQKTTIDRFDVRATLSSLPTDEKPRHVEKNEPERRRKPTVLDTNENEYMKKLLNFERYRLVMHNDLNKVSETTRLGLVNKKNDLLSEAQMRKLKNNWFGTSGETSISGDHVTNNNRNFTTRHQGVSIGFDYNMVEPDADDNLPVQMNIPTATTIPDLDDCDAELDLDCVDKPQLNPEAINEVLNRYGLNHDDFNILLDSTSRSSKEIISKLKHVQSEAKRLCEAVQSTEVTKQQGFYGPALPPEMEKREKNGPSSHPSGNASPIQQRSPSSAESLIKTRDNDSSRDVSSNSNIDHGFVSHPLDSTQTAISTNSKQSESLEVSSQKKLSSSIALSTDAKSTPNTNRLSMVSESKTSTNSSTQIQINMRNDREIEKHSDPQEITDDETPRPRRAVTPLAYKRYCRSSRSLSRDRISSSRRRSRNSSSSSNTSKSRISSSSSTDSSPDRRFSSGSRRKRVRSRSPRDRYSHRSRHKYHRRVYK